jgi:Fe-S oxidoreductase
MNVSNDDSRIQKGLKVLDTSHDNKLISHLNACVHCGLCAESCMYFLSSGDAKYIPARKVELVSSLYRRYYTLSGRILPGLTGARELNGDTIKEMIDLLFGACTLCGRCTLHCSIGVDIGYVVGKGREMLAEMGEVPATLQATVDTALETGNNMGISDEEFRDTLTWLEDDLRMEVHDDNACIPLNVAGKKVLYTLNPREPKFFPLSITAMAKVLYAAKESWTLSTKMYDVTNYGYFSKNRDHARIIAERLHREMQNIGAGVCVLAECGHGSAAFRWEAPNYLAEEFPYEVLTSVELMADYIRKGRIQVDPEKNRKRVTLHDPCNLVRQGGVIEEQRYIVSKCATDFVEMTPHGIDNFCCGGGGGQLAMSEYNDRRMSIAKIKADQIRNTGAAIVVTPCHNCVDQLLQINAAFKLNVKIMTLAELVADAIVL